MTTRQIAEAFPPGDFIKEELEAREWSQVELAEIIGRHPQTVTELVTGKRAITPELAKALGDAFGTSAQYWMNLDTSYRLWLARDTDNAVSRRARLYHIAPIREMAKRHWLELSQNLDVIEQRVISFFRIPNIETPIEFPHAARRRGAGDLSPAQKAWIFRAAQLAHAVHAESFSAQSFKRAMDELRQLLSHTADVALVPGVLANAGIRFLILEHLPRTGIDGVTFWLDEKSPVIVLSLRYGRIDAFWYTLMHELFHVSRRDGLRRRDAIVLDTDLVKDAETTEPELHSEREVDALVTEFLVQRSELDDFILRTSPLYSKKKIANFAARIKVHPGIVVGQLQFRGESQGGVGWNKFRGMLVDVRQIVTQSALTDGWGHAPPPLN